MVRLTDRPMPIPVGFDVTKGSKIEAHLVGRDARPVVGHLDLHPTPVVHARAHHQPSRAIGRVRHGVEGVHHEIQEDLLQLNAVARHQQEPGREIAVDDDIPEQGVAAHQGDDVGDQVVEQQRATFGSALLEEGAQMLDHLVRVLVRKDDVLEDLAQVVLGVLARGDEAEAGRGIGAYRGQRLAQLVDDGRAQLAHGRDA